MIGYPIKKMAVSFWILLLFSACLQTTLTPPEGGELPPEEVWTYASGKPLNITATPFQPEDITSVDYGEADGQTEERQSTEETAEVPVIGEDIHVYISSSVPQGLRDALLTARPEVVEGSQMDSNNQLVHGDECISPSLWVYTAVVPFPNTIDSVSMNDLQLLWRGETPAGLAGFVLAISPATEALLVETWGEPSRGDYMVVPADELVDYAWASKHVMSLVPFDELNPRWKVLSVDGSSPLDQQFDPARDPLTFSFCLVGSMGTNATGPDLPLTNRDPGKLTSIMMTGVTALVRATAHRMETHGIHYPTDEIAPLLLDADFTHISNEVAFAEGCPYPDPYQADLRFCSDPKYFELLEYLDIDIIELTGNHIQDWSREDFVNTLIMYENAGMLYYGGGRNAEAAGKPLLLEHNGNKIAFVGCNAVGPPGAWAGESTSGNLPCGDYEWIRNLVQDLVDEGYLPIVTLQHNEFYSLMKTGPQIRDFNPLAEAGAVIVSGSQAHYPNPFGFVGDHFIHYGLGNLFFDQMDAYVAFGIQRQFVDRHFFYNGEYIGTQIFTLYLEDFAQPRLMTPEEREAFLTEAFLASGW
ncbi:MAG: CapA family protein [Anaerolineae bacterium]|nr:CapA family protein [Anaerolineae bacterium]